MQMRHPECFLAVAEELHFTRAAQRLHLSQSPVVPAHQGAGAGTGGQAMLGLVAVGLGVTIVPQTIAMLPAPGVVFRPLKQRLIYEHVVLWRAKTVSSLAAAFLDGLPGAGEGRK
jgi:DNA-binding transcriptional LysR family regulator